MECYDGCARTIRFRAAKFLLVHNVVLLVPSTNDSDVALAKELINSLDLPCNVLEDPKNATPDMLFKTLLVDMGRFHQIVGDEEKWFYKGISWLVPEENVVEPPKGLRLDSNFLTFQTSHQGFSVKEIYRAKSRLFENFLGVLSFQGSLEMDREIPSQWERRRDLQGINLTAAALHLTAISQLEKGGTFSGFAPECLGQLQQRSNFSLSWTMPEDGSYGAPLSDNGSWSGLVGMLQQKEADVALGLAITLERSRVVDFAVALNGAKGTLIIVNPDYVGRSADIDSTSFIAVFTPMAWIGLLALLFALAAIHQMFHLLQNTMPGDNWDLVVGIGSSWTYAYEALMRFSPTMDFSRYPLSKRVFFLVSVTYPIIVMAHFDAVLTSFLTVVSPPKVMESAFDVPGFGYRVVTLANSRASTAMKTAPPDSGWHVVYHSTMKGREDAFQLDLATLAQSAFDKPREVAIFGHQYFYVNEPRLTPLVNLRDAFVDHFGLALQSDSEFLDLFSYNVVKLHSSGLVEFMVNKWMGRREPSDSCGCKRQEEAWVLGFANLFFPTAILLLGFILALVFICAEHCAKTRKKSMETKPESPTISKSDTSPNSERI